MRWERQVVGWEGGCGASIDGCPYDMIGSNVMVAHTGHTKTRRLHCYPENKHLLKSNMRKGRDNIVLDISWDTNYHDI